MTVGAGTIHDPQRSQKRDHFRGVPTYNTHEPDHRIM